MGLLRQFLLDHAGRGFRVGVISYIGTHGARSAEHRLNLVNTIREFNRYIRDPRLRLGLRIVGTRQKGEFLNVAGTTVHIDDRLDCLDSCSDTIVTLWALDRARHHRRHRILRSLREALGQVERHCRTVFGALWQIPF